MAHKIMITRPSDVADEFSKELIILGYETIIEPVLKINVIPHKAPFPEAYEALIFTSARAIKFFKYDKADRNKPVFVVGPQTEEAAESKGYTNILNAKGDGKDLAFLIRSTLPDISKPLLHPSGRQKGTDVQSLLKSFDIEVNNIVLYETEPVKEFTAGAINAMREGSIQAVTFFSSFSAESFFQKIEHYDLWDTLNSIKALCISNTVLDYVQNPENLKNEQIWDSVWVAEKPNRNGMKEIIGKTCKKS